MTDYLDGPDEATRKTSQQTLVEDAGATLDDLEPHPVAHLMRMLVSPRDGAPATIRVQLYPDNEENFRQALMAHRLPRDVRPQTLDWSIPTSGLCVVPKEILRASGFGFAVAWVPAAGVAYMEMDFGERFDPSTWEGPEPDGVVRSKRGDHFYWRLDPSTSPTELRRVLRSLAIRYGGDPAVAVPDHPMRLPGFPHQKDPDVPFAVKIVHESKRDAPWKAWALLRGLGVVADHSEADWRGYEIYNSALKAEVTKDAMGEFGSEVWKTNSETVSAWLKLRSVYQRLFSFNPRRGWMGPDLYPWVPGHSPRWWRSLETLYRGWLAVRRAQFITDQPEFSQELLEEAKNPMRPEWLAETEPRMRAWAAYVEAELQTADERCEKEGHWSPPKLRPYAPEAVTDEMIQKAPPAPGTNDSRNRKGSWDLRTIDWVGLMSTADLYLDCAGDGKHTVTCPWADTHGDGNPEATVFEPTDIRAGGYHCFHSHGHTTSDLMDWLVERLGEEAVENYCGRYSVTIGTTIIYGRPEWPVVHPAGSKSEGAPIQDRRENTAAVLEHHRIAGRYNEMTHRIEWQVADGKLRWTEQQAFDEIRELGRIYGFRPSREIMEEHLRSYVRGHSYHPVRDWIDSKPWDGQDRLPELLSTLILSSHIEPNLAARQLRKWMISCVAALLSKSGVKAEHVLVLVGPQGIGKTTWFSRLAPMGVRIGKHLNPDSKDSVGEATGVWITELGEMRSTVRRSDAEKLKAFLSQDVDVYRPPYGRFAEEFPRRTVFCGSENSKDFLRDPTGNRRFWVVEVEDCLYDHEIDMQQVWAQITTLYNGGEQWWLDKGDEVAVAAINEGHMASDPIEEAIERYWVPDPNGAADQTEIRDSIKDEFTSWTQREARAMVTVLRRMADQLRVQRRRSGGRSIWPLSRRGCDDPISRVRSTLLDN